MLLEKTVRRKNENSETLKNGAENVNPDIFYTLMPIGYVSRVWALLPVKFVRNKLDHTSLNGRTDFPVLTYGIALALAITGAQCWGLYRDFYGHWQNRTKVESKLIIAVTGTDVLVAIIFTCFVIFSSSLRWKPVLRAINKIIQADKILDFNTTKNLRRSSIILIIFTLTYMMSMAILDYKVLNMQAALNTKIEYDTGGINYCPFYLMQMVILTMQMQYAVILMNLGERFMKINSTIEEIIKSNAKIDYFRNDVRLAVQELRPKSSVFPNQRLHNRFKKAPGSIEGVINGNNIMESIDQLIKVYDLLCDSIIHVDKAYGVPLLMCTLSGLVHLVVSFYFLWFEVHDPNRQWYKIVDQLGWITVHIYKMCLFIQPSHMVTSKVRDTGSLVSQALATKWNPLVQEQLESFAMQLLHRPVEFTACGLFRLDRGLMASIAGAVTTYLMILVQFRGKNSDNSGTIAL